MMKYFALLLLTIMSASAQDIVCPGGTVSVKGRFNAVKFNNELRASIARGKSKPGPTGGKNIFMLRYDCELEKFAQAQAESCPSTTSSPILRPGRGENYYRLTLSVGAVKEPDAFTYAETKWWDEIKRGWKAGPDNVYTAAVAATKIESYAQMAWGATTRLGCGIKQCTGFRAVICQYMTRGPIIGEAMVEPGTGCKTDAECTTFPGSVCDVGNQTCIAPEGINPVPPASTSTSTTVSTTTELSTTTTQEECTGAGLLTDAIRDDIIARHNAMRRNIAIGTPLNGALTRGCQSMFALKYSCALETSAQTFAEKCDAIATTPIRGRNTLLSFEADPAVAIVTAIETWRDQAAVATFDPSVRLSAAVGLNNVATVGQFATMAHNKATEIGCGFARCNISATIFLCRYRAARSDTGLVYPATGTTTGCTQPKCEAINNLATCDATSGLCQAP